MQTSDITDADLLALIHGWAAIGGRDPLDALAVLYAESSFKPTALNAQNCQGLNQFCASSGVALPAGYLELSAADQLGGFILPWWARGPSSARQSARDLYWFNALPATYHGGAPDDFVVTRDPALAQGILGAGAMQIQAGDFSALLARRTGDARFAELKSRVQALGGGSLVATGGSSRGFELGLLAAAGLGAVLLAKRR